MRRPREERGTAEYGSLPFSVLRFKDKQISNLTFDFPHYGLYEMHLLFTRTAQLSLNNRTEPACSELSV